ncbi:hypothetical protein EGW08_018129 [Elysia chlorotica]|uniref:PIPK domain-containing protein n=1 Tax=Elysia chlorotica TaxID=188477 RepID=A0A433SXV2_ELYCH|nr:hypothetical protein EGW08_018129 [Elysia chlorotica]
MDFLTRVMEDSDEESLSSEDEYNIHLSIHVATMAEVERANGKTQHQDRVRWKKKKSSGSVGPSPSEVPVVAVTSSDDGLTIPSSSRKSRKKRISSWRRLKRRLTKKGVVPVNKDHPRYEFLSCVREGIRQVSTVPNQGPQDALGPEDFSQVIKKKCSFNGKEFEFESYASSVFATIRRSVGVAEDVYMRAVAPTNLPYLEFISNSKSGQDFFLSNDMQFMFKSNRQRDVRFFLCLLEDYLKHFICFPHSLLVKYIGCYTIKFTGRPRKFFLVMQSIFFPSVRIEERFDIKGCTAGRYQKPNSPDSNIVTVLKDQNFLDEEMDFGDQGDWFMAQISADTEFLERHNCMDYSLLLGRQRRHFTEKQIDHVATVVDRIGLSIHHTSNVRLRAPSMDSEFIDSDCENLSTSRSNNLRLNGTLNTNNINETNTSDNNNLRDKPGRRHGTDMETPDSAYFHDDDIHNTTTTTSPAEAHEDPVSAKFAHRNSEWVRSPAVSATVIMPQVKPGLMFPRCLSDGVEKFRDENRRLLPKCQNRLHIIDGQEYRYFLGVVDFLTRFDWRQKMAQYWKIIKYRCGEHSTKRPDVYRKRFVDFLNSKVR